MRRYILLFIALIANFTPLFSQVRWSEPTIERVGDDRAILSIVATIDGGWHIYDLERRKNAPVATSMTLRLPSGVEAVGEIGASEKPTLYTDEYFGGEIGYFEGRVTLSQELKIDSQGGGKVGVLVEWMACNDGSCMPPSEASFEVELPRPKTNMWRVIVEAILWGFAALLTPCVFPMIPMTVSFFMKGDRQRGRWAALLYGAFIVALYTLPIAAIILITYLFGGDTVTANIFNWIATHWLPNTLFFVIFMLFAASFLGAFEITLPSKWVNASDSKADKNSIGGIFFLAFTLVLVSFSCTGPIVGSVLIKSVSGELWEPIITMLAFSVAFALPFALVALSPSLMQRLPKSGGWLSSVKIVLGFLELALGLKFLSVADQIYGWGILPREVYLALWIVIFSLLGFYLLGKIHFAHDSKAETIGVGRLFLAIITLSFVVYMIPGMWGAPLKPLSGYLPPATIENFSSVESPQQSTITTSLQHPIAATGLSGFEDLYHAQEYAQSVGKPLLVDLTGAGCVNCREMEARVWSDERVNRMLRDDFVIVALPMDSRVELPQDRWITTQSGRVLKSAGRIWSHTALEMFGVNSQPTYIILGRGGEQLTPPRGYDLDVDAYIEFLRGGLEKFNM